MRYCWICSADVPLDQDGYCHSCAIKVKEARSRIQFLVLSMKSRIIHIGRPWATGVTKTECGVAFYTAAPGLYKEYKDTTTKEYEELYTTSPKCQKCFPTTKREEV